MFVSQHGLQFPCDKHMYIPNACIVAKKALSDTHFFPSLPTYPTKSSVTPPAPRSWSSFNFLSSSYGQMDTLPKLLAIVGILFHPSPQTNFSSFGCFLFAMIAGPECLSSRLSWRVRTCKHPQCWWWGQHLQKCCVAKLGAFLLEKKRQIPWKTLSMIDPECDFEGFQPPGKDQ